MTMQQSKLLTVLIASALFSGALISNSHAADQATTQGSTGATVADDVVTSSIRKAISADPQAAELPVSVTTRKGVVVITGEVPSAAVGDRVVQLVATVNGVRQVKNELRVKSSS